VGGCCGSAPAHISVGVHYMDAYIKPMRIESQSGDGRLRGREIPMRTPMKRFGNPEELVGLAVLLASGAFRFLTGQCIAVDGGCLASVVNS
jgi:NAD(P)-dependent dehydrogenase (short-subunit alcohol dehydrogenase family)